MVFSSLLFLFFFLPLVLIAHTALPPRLRNGFLLLASLVFYAIGDWKNLPLLLALTAFDYGACRWMDALTGKKRRAVMGVSVGVNVLVLVVFKYLKLLVPGLPAYPALPLGISFFIFQSISCLVDVYRGTVQAERNLRDYAAYILLFPQLIAGPIVRYSDVSEALHSRQITPAGLEKGMKTFLAGLAAKVLLANRLGALCAALQAIPNRGGAASWLVLVSCAFQYYYDFFGYSLMAIGMGRMLGFSFPQNFNQPFAATSIQDLWRRWHMTLGTWLRSYIYIPLGGSRHGKARMVLSLLITWTVSGLWHGAGWNFLAWGLFFAVFIILETLFYGRWLEKHRGVAHVYTLILFILSWGLFLYETPAEIFAFAGQLVSPAVGLNTAFLTLNDAFPLALAVLLAVPAVGKKLKEATEKYPRLGNAAYVLLFALSVLSLIRAQYNPFLYFRF